MLYKYRVISTSKLSPFTTNPKIKQFTRFDAALKYYNVVKNFPAAHSQLIRIKDNAVLRDSDDRVLQ